MNAARVEAALTPAYPRGPIETCELGVELANRGNLRLYGHVARLPAEDPAHHILSFRYPSGWTMPRWRPQASCLRQVEAYLKDMGMTGLASAWAMARRRPIYL